MKCKNPCIGVCAPSAECRVISHVPRCSCPVGYIGNPFTECQIQQGKLNHILFNNKLCMIISVL